MLVKVLGEDRGSYCKRFIASDMRMRVCIKVKGDGDSGVSLNAYNTTRECNSGEGFFF